MHYLILLNQTKLRYKEYLKSDRKKGPRTSKITTICNNVLNQETQIVMIIPFARRMGSFISTVSIKLNLTESKSRLKPEFTFGDYLGL